jgi:hypothetical protein
MSESGMDEMRGRVVAFVGLSYLRRSISSERKGPASVWLREREQRRKTGGCVDIDALSRKNLIKIVHIETRDMTFQKHITLDQLLLDALGVPSGDQGLSVPILLMAGSTSSSTSRTSGMLGIALIRTLSGLELAREGGGSCRRCHPTGLALIFLLLHRAQAS